jgi:DNA (cytosine-5)-methyltransferase 1
LRNAVAFGRPSKGPKTVRHAIAALPRAGRSGDTLHDMPERRTLEVRKRIKEIPKDGGSRNSLSPSRRLKCHDSCGGFKDVYGRMSWDKVAPTITTGCFNPSKGRFLHPTQNRAIRH